jgi:SagB-type dehydrogenase family enzyme
MHNSGSIAKLFHEQSRQQKVAAGNRDNWPEEWKTIYFKEYKRMPVTNLPSVKEGMCNLNLEQALLKRNSTRKYSPTKEVTAEELSTLLYYSAGIKNKSDDDLNQSRRHYPSGGARYPLEMYVCIQHCSEIDAGVYHYNVKGHHLEKLLDSSYTKQLYNAVLYPWAAEAPILCIVTAVWDRTFMKYNDFGYRSVLLEAGYLGQNMQLVAQAMHIKSCPLLGFDNQEIEKLLDIQNEDESSICLTIFGKN